MIIAHCNHCGCDYDADSWQQLQGKGTQNYGIPGVTLVLADCPCLTPYRATIAAAKYFDLYIDAPTLAIIEREYDNQLMPMVEVAA